MVNSVAEALAFAKTQHVRRADWEGMCQKFVRSAYGIGGGFASAWLQWQGLPGNEKVLAGTPGGSIDSAPVGAPLFFKGSGPYGHVVIAAHPHKDGTAMCWSNDLIVPGRIDYVPRRLATTKWGQTYLGWGKSLNGVVLPLGNIRHEDRQYEGLRAAIAPLKVARDTARRQGDREDARRISEQIVVLRKLYRELRRY